MKLDASHASRRPVRKCLSPFRSSPKAERRGTGVLPYFQTRDAGCPACHPAHTCDLINYDSFPY
jgi:hypothetical protein